MPPNRRKKSKRYASIDTKRVADDDDDIFETDDKPIKKPFKRYKASSATHHNLRSSGPSSATKTIDNKHVHTKRKISSTPEKKMKSPVSITPDSDQVNFTVGFLNKNK